jgi:hypothetical protein
MYLLFGENFNSILLLTTNYSLQLYLERVFYKLFSTKKQSFIWFWWIVFFY